MTGPLLPQPVLVIGCGLMGTSVALAVRAHGIEVQLADARPANVELAASIGAGIPGPIGDPGLVVVAVPPSAVPSVVVDALARWPHAIVTDVASVKGAPHHAVAGSPGAERYVGSHPMAGSERSGPLAASAKLFEGRPWAITPDDRADPQAVEAVRVLAQLVGAVLLEMDPDDHDEAVALVSHLPHVLSVLTAGQLDGAPADHLAMAGPGLRDVTRIAGSDTALWREILAGNAERVARRLSGVRDQLDTLIAALGTSPDDVEKVLQRGQDGRRSIPGRHGDADTPMATVFVQIPDRPGELSKLMGHTGESGVNIEDIRIDHELGRPVGLVEVIVAESSAATLVAALTARGWAAYS